MLNPILIDTVTFVQEAQSLSGKIRLAELDERVSAHELLADANSTVCYRIHRGIGGGQRPFLRIGVSTTLHLVCQRCLQPLAFALNDDAHMVLFADESTLDEAMSADEIPECLLQAPETDLKVLLEDQILMAIPFATRHENCANAALNRINQEQPNPFAKLARLKSSQPLTDF